MHAITRRVGTTVAIVLAVVLGTATRAAAVEPEWVEGQWIGGFEGVDGTVYMSAQVEAEGGVLTGSLELPLQSDGAVRLEKVKATADALHFDVRGSQTRLAFDGKRREAGRITGTVRQGRDAANFELLKVATLLDGAPRCHCRHLRARARPQRPGGAVAGRPDLRRPGARAGRRAVRAGRSHLGGRSVARLRAIRSS